jgi:hypothetical protein
MIGLLAAMRRLRSGEKSGGKKNESANFWRRPEMKWLRERLEPFKAKPGMIAGLLDIAVSGEKQSGGRIADPG